MLNDTEWVQVNTSADFNNSPPMIIAGRMVDQLAVFVISNQGVGIYTLAPPTANAGADLTVTEGDTLVLSLAVTDNGGHPVSDEVTIFVEQTNGSSGSSGGGGGGGGCFISALD